MHAKMHLILAVTKDNVIAVDGQLPFHIPHDLRWFRMNTYGCAVIMGRKTWDSLPVRPLPGRLNIVLSRTPQRSQDRNVRWVTSMQDAVAYAYRKRKMPVCIGGREIYNLAMPYVKRIIITRIHAAAPAGKQHVRMQCCGRCVWRSRTFQHGDLPYHFELLTV